MDIIFYDLEVFKYDWTVTFKSLRTGEYWFYHNDNNGVRDFMRKKNIILCGFNNKMYDDYILLAILVGADNYILKKLNDWIIEEKKLPWEFPFLQGHVKNFDSFDLRDDLYMGLSLKVIEGNLGMNIEESSIPFDIDRPLTPDEIEETKLYNKADVDATERLFENRKSYLRSKVFLSKMIDMDMEDALKMTNGKLSARFLNAKRISRNDERDLIYPKNLKRDVIPKEIFEFFNQMLNPDISDDKLFKSKLKLNIEGVEYVYGFGGVHAGIPNYIGESTNDRMILLHDVRSLYPSIMVEYDLLSRNTPIPEKFKEIYYERIEAKKNGEKAKSDALKLVLNTSYGITLDKHNDMYDPRQGRHVCIYGQLFLTDLMMNMKGACPSLTVVQLNTDGIMYEVDKKDLSNLKKVIDEWEDRTGFVLEGELIEKIIQKDVNNYVMLNNEGKVTAKGGMVGNYNGGDINNNSLVVVHNAIVNYLLYDKPVEDTINEETDILNFQIIARTGSTYLKTYHTINGEKVEVQNVNRVYATKDKRYGTIHKFKLNKDGTERYDKIANLPEHCIIDNRNELTINDIDKDFYIEMAKKRIKQFIGEK